MSDHWCIGTWIFFSENGNPMGVHAEWHLQCSSGFQTKRMNSNLYKGNQKTFVEIDVLH